MSNVWRVAHTEIEGAIIDRDRGYPDVELEMHPVGTMLPVDEQGRELVIKIGRSRTVLDDAGITALREFLDIQPNPEDHT